MEFVNLNQNYDSKVILDNFSITFPNHGVVCLLGKSGCGKTTLVNQIAREMDREVSFIFQEDRLLPWLTPSENIDIVTKNFGKDKSQSRKWLKLFELDGEKDQAISSLSGGMQRRVAIARAMAYDKPVVIMDEPFKGLDWETKKKIADAVFMDKQKLYILITHDQYEANTYGDLIFMLDGPPLTIISQK